MDHLDSQNSQENIVTNSNSSNNNNNNNNSNSNSNSNKIITMKTTAALIFSFVFLARVGSSNCSQLRGMGEAPLNDSTELMGLEEFEESYNIEENGDDPLQRELSPYRIRIKVKNTQTISFKVKAVCRDSSNSIIETSSVKDILRDMKVGTDITNNHCAKVEVRFYLNDLGEWKRLSHDSSNIVLTEYSDNEQTRLKGYTSIDYDGFVIEPNSGNSVVNNSKFCFKIASFNWHHDSFLVKYRKDDDDCN